MTGALACQPVTARQLQWNWTPAGQVALQPCPIGANGLARWYCADTPAGPVWQGTSPDMSDCKSLAITTLEGKKKSVDFKKIILLYIFCSLKWEKNIFVHREKLYTIFEITRTIFSNSEKVSSTFRIKGFFNLFLDVSQIYKNNSNWKKK